MMRADLLFFCISVLGNIFLYYMLLSLVEKKEPPFFLLLLSLLTSLLFVGIRLLPLYFGVHFLLQIILLIIILVIFCGLPWSISFILALLAGITLGLIEGVAVPLLAGIFSCNYNLREIISSPMSRLVFALLSLVLLAILAYIINRRGWRLPLTSRMAVSREERKRYSPGSNHLFMLYLIQALILIFLYIILYNYYTKVFPGFTLETLGLIGGAVIIAQYPVGRIFFKKYRTRSQIAKRIELHPRNEQIKFTNASGTA